jgi:hypothetical protein
MAAIKRFILIILLFNSTIASSQATQLDDKKFDFFPKKYGEKNWNILLGLDARRSFFAGTKVKINGLKIGASFKGVHRFGVGFYWLNKNVVFNDLYVNELDQDVTDPEVRFNLGYSSIFYERVFYKTRWWDIAFPVHLGGGSITGSYKDTLGAFPVFTSNAFSALIPSVQTKFYPLKWIAIRVSGGYRFTFNTQQEIKKAFRTVFFGYGVSINPVALYHAIFKKNEKNKSIYEEGEEDDWH